MAETTICAVCQHALDLLSTGAGVKRWIHTAQDPDDHAPVPVTPGPEWRGRCDFCSHPVADWVLPARDFPVPGAEKSAVSRGGWAACDVCAPLIESNRWNEVERRAVKFFAAQHMDAQQYVELFEGAARYGAVGVPSVERFAAGLGPLYRRLRKNITGAARRADEGENQ